MARLRRVAMTILILLGLVLLAMLVFDFVGYRASNEQRYCVVAAQPVVDF